MKHSIIIEVNTKTDEYSIQTTFTDKTELAKFLAACTANYLENFSDCEVTKPDKPS